MILFESYEDFCKAFSADHLSVARAELLLYVQDWIIRLSGEDDFYPIAELLEFNNDKSSLRLGKQDGVSKIITEVDSAVRHIAGNMRENIIRENVKLPVYQVKEINSYGLNWLSRRPGRTIKEKISNSTSLMAVKRRMSLDTGENRLYIALLKELNDILETKTKFLGKNMTEVEREFWNFINSVLYVDEIEEIGRWENMPPNNTLLSDQYYKKIWKGWEELKDLDRFVEECNHKISERLSEIFYVEFLTKARSVLRVPQVPTIVDYEKFKVKIDSPLFYLVDGANNKLTIKRDTNCLHLEYRQKSVDVSFDGSTAVIIASGEKNSMEITSGRILKVVDLLFIKLGISVKGVVAKKIIERKNYKYITMDLFQLHPEYVNEDGNIETLKGRLALQKFAKYDLPCDDVNAVIIQSEEMVPYTIQSAVIDNSLPQLGQLMHLLEDQVVTGDFTFVFPDAFDEFQLSLVHKAARMAYRSVKSFPRSIGIAFDYQESADFEIKFNKDDILIIVDIVDDDVVFTMVQGLVSEDVKRDFPDYKGYIWERHPSTSYSIDDELSVLYDELRPTGFFKYAGNLFEAIGIEGIIDEKDKLSVIYDEESGFSFNKKISDIVRNFRINISDKVNKYLLDHQEIIGKSRTHIISLSENILYKGTCSFEQIDRSRALYGYKKYETLQQNTSTLLWRDHLPELAIKLLYGKFMLVDKETITPKFNVKKKILIDNEFTLPANGKTEYRFNLVQSDSNKKTKFMAVVKSPAFPLTEEVLCRLDMTYEYGAENPYVLFFRPKDKMNSKFIEAKVTWKKISEYPMYQLPSPKFAPEKTWEELQNYIGTRGIEDLIYGQRGLINRLISIQAGYSTMDLSKYDIQMKDRKNGKTFSIETETNSGELVNIIFSEKNKEPDKDNHTSVDFGKLQKVSFDLSKSLNKRYKVDLSDYEDDYGYVWKQLKNGWYACFIEMYTEQYGTITVAVYENQFDHPENFHDGIRNVSFEVPPPYMGKYRAQKIHDEDSGKPFTEYWALSIRRGNKPGFYTYGGRIYFLMHVIFAGRNSIHNPDCPSEFRDTFLETLEAWDDTYHSCDDEYIKSRIFGLMSISGPDMGEIYYNIAHENIEKYLDNKKFRLNDYIGYGLGDFTLLEEKELFKDIERIKEDKIICILSKAVWGNPDFIWNFPINLTFKYFQIAINRIGELLNGKNNRKIGKDITMCLEYILAVYRLRERYDDNQSIMMRLSQNTPKIQLLYEYVEEIIDRVGYNLIDIRCMLELEFSHKGLYENIPNLLYALLICITGDSEAGDISIAGLSMEDLEV